jgi:IS30 family transposase
MEIGLSSSEIARQLGRHRATIHREIRRNRCVDGYRPDSADRRAWARKLRGSRIGRSSCLRTYVEDRLAMGWSPEQIAGRMEHEEKEYALSAESIYRHAYSSAGRALAFPDCSRSASRSGVGEGATAGESPPSPTERRSTSG